jgi:hypothetical protein
MARSSSHGIVQNGEGENEKCPEEYARLQDAASYEVRTIGSHSRVCIGTIARTAIYHDLISFDDLDVKVQAHVEIEKASPILLAGDVTRLGPSYYDKIQLSEPFCWIWNGLTDSLDLAKFNALARYALMVRGHFGGLCDMSFGIQEVFPQLCADIARGQDVKNMKSIWEGGRCYGQGLVEGDTKETEDHKQNGVQADEDVSEEQQKSSRRAAEEQQNSRNIVCLASLRVPCHALADIEG